MDKTQKFVDRKEKKMKMLTLNSSPRPSHIKCHDLIIVLAIMLAILSGCSHTEKVRIPPRVELKAQYRCNWIFHKCGTYAKAVCNPKFHSKCTVGPTGYPYSRAWKRRRIIAVTGTQPTQPGNHSVNRQKVQRRCRHIGASAGFRNKTEN